MKKILKKCMILSLLAGIAVFFAACNEWTDPESNGIKGPSFSNDDPDTYARYTEALRTYKAQDHTRIYGWYDNSSKVPVSHAQHLASIPDSMDIVSLLHPDNLADWEIAEIDLVRTKGTKVIYTFSYADMLTAYEATLPTLPAEPAPAESKEGDDELDVDGFLDYLARQTDLKLALADKYNYDGVAVFYEPMPLTYMEPDVLVREKARQEVLIGKLKAWRQAHVDKLFVFEGLPQNLEDKSLLGDCDYIVVRAFSAISHAQLSLHVLAAAGEGVPVDRFIIAVETLPLDVADLTTGRFADASNALTLSAVTEAALWVASPESGLEKVGLGIYNLQHDYYNSTVIYKYTREAISIMNPSPKN